MSDTAPKQFHLGDILSITDGRLMSPTHTDGIYQILNFMTGDSLFTHQLPRAMEECQPHLIKQLPWTADVKFNTDHLADMSKDEAAKEVDVILKDLVKRYGEYHWVYPLARDAVTHKGPLQELSEMVNPEKIIVVQHD